MSDTLREAGISASSYSRGGYVRTLNIRPPA
jgi:hypothetical protein